MNTKSLYCFYAILGLLLTVQSCKQKTKAGLGGNAVLQLTAKHHGNPVDSCVFYIKFNTQNAPEDGQYDLVKKADTGSGAASSVQISGLKKGDYYLFATGWDHSIQESVKGGLPYTIRDEGVQNLILAVTEIH